MNTFLTLPSYEASAFTLDRQRLGKQRIESVQILWCLDARTRDSQPASRRNHPCTEIWDGWANHLIAYTEAVCTEWIRRGYKDNQMARLTEMSWHGRFRHEPGDKYPVDNFAPRWAQELMPAWRARLLAKDPDHYGQFGWTETPIEAFPWPNR